MDPASWRTDPLEKMMNRLPWNFCVVMCLLLAMRAPDAIAQSTIAITIDPAAEGKPIAEDYTGFSYEMQRVLPDENGTYYFRADNRPLINIFKTLGIKHLRIGGNTADRATVHFPEEKDLDQLFGFARAADLKVMFTMRLHGGDPAASARVAQYIMSKYKDQVSCFAIGNEPNVFMPQYKTFVEEFKKYMNAILAVAPDGKFAGPGSTAGHGDWARDFAGEFPNNGPVKFITWHLYPGGNSGLVTDPADGRKKMLSAQWLTDYSKLANVFVPTVLSKGFAYRLEEANSFWNGGRKDASDTQAAALWGLEYLYWWASQGCSGISYHTGDYVAKEGENTRCNYAAFWTSPGGYDAHPLAYGIAAFELAGHGTLIPAKVDSNPQQRNVSVYSTTSPGGIFITLINKETDAVSQPINVEINLSGVSGGKLNQSRSMALTAPNNDLAGTSGIKLGDAPIREDGTWTGAWSAPRPRGGIGHFAVSVPPSSAIIVKLSGE